MQAQDQHSLTPPPSNTVLAQWGSEATHMKRNIREGGIWFTFFGKRGKLASILLAYYFIHPAAELHILPPGPAEDTGPSWGGQGWDRMGMLGYSGEGTNPGWVELKDHLELAEEEEEVAERKSSEREEKLCGRPAFWNS